MRKETAIKRIENKVKKVLSNESESVRNYISNVIYLMWQGLETDADAYEHTSTENLNFAIEVNLEDEIGDLLDEARKECSKKIIEQ